MLCSGAHFLGAGVFFIAQLGQFWHHFFTSSYCPGQWNFSFSWLYVFVSPKCPPSTPPCNVLQNPWRICLVLLTKGDCWTHCLPPTPDTALLLYELVPQPISAFSLRCCLGWAFDCFYCLKEGPTALSSCCNSWISWRDSNPDCTEFLSIMQTVSLVSATRLSWQCLHWPQGNLDSAAAFPWQCPWGCVIPNHQASLPSGSLKFCKHVRNPRSVLSSKWQPRR